MINTLLTLLLIQVIAVCYVMSGFPDSLKSGLKWVITKGKMSGSNYRLKPFDCPLCMTFWSCIIYLLCTTQLTIPYIAAAIVLAMFTSTTENIIRMVQDLITALINVIYRYVIDRSTFSQDD